MNWIDELKRYYNSNLYEADSYLVIIIECFCEEWTNTWNWLRGELVASYKASAHQSHQNQFNSSLPNGKNWLIWLIAGWLAPSGLWLLKEVKQSIERGSTMGEFVELSEVEFCGLLAGPEAKATSPQKRQASSINSSFLSIQLHEINWIVKLISLDCWIGMELKENKSTKEKAEEPALFWFVFWWVMSRRLLLQRRRLIPFHFTWNSINSTSLQLSFTHAPSAKGS